MQNLLTNVERIEGKLDILELTRYLFMSWLLEEQHNSLSSNDSLIQGVVETLSQHLGVCLQSNTFQNFPEVMLFSVG